MKKFSVKITIKELNKYERLFHNLGKKTFISMRLKLENYKEKHGDLT